MKNTNTDIPAFPLAWPVTNPRTPSFERQSSRFGKSNWNQVIDGLYLELGRLGAENVVISTNQPVRKDGAPYAQERRIEDPGVAVYFTLEGTQVCFPCDRWISVLENLRAIALHIEAMRGQQRWGVGTSKQAFAGYKALMPTNEENWWDVLKCDREDHEGIVLMQFKRQAREAHPDRPGGSEAAMQRLNIARDRALAEKGGK